MHQKHWWSTFCRNGLLKVPAGPSLSFLELSTFWGGRKSTQGGLVFSGPISFLFSQIFRCSGPKPAELASSLWSTYFWWKWKLGGSLWILNARQRKTWIFGPTNICIGSRHELPWTANGCLCSTLVS
jgi:hypothetical protein